MKNITEIKKELQRLEDKIRQIDAKENLVERDYRELDRLDAQEYMLMWVLREEELV